MTARKTVAAKKAARKTTPRKTAVAKNTPDSGKASKPRAAILDDAPAGKTVTDPRDIGKSVNGRTDMSGSTPDLPAADSGIPARMTKTEIEKVAADAARKGNPAPAHLVADPIMAKQNEDLELRRRPATKGAEEEVDVVVPRGFTLTIGNGPVNIAAGTTRLPKSQATHKYSIANGVTLKKSK